MKPGSTQPLLRTGTSGLRRLQVAMVAAGLAALALMYATQALLPSIGDTFGVSAATASLTVSVTTGVLAVAVLPLSAAAERFGRVRVMSVGLTVACLSVAAASAAPDFALLLAVRAVDGLALGAVVAVSMGHIGAEVHPDAAGPAIGVYVAATTLGGLLGRLVPAGVEDVANWRAALLVLAAIGAVCAVAFVRVVPPGRPPDRRERTGAVREHLRDRGMVRLCVVGMLAMGGFVATYNYLTYRLLDQPFRLSTGLVGLVFTAYLAGTVTSTTATRLAERVGRRVVLLCAVAVAITGIVLTLPDTLPFVLAGLVIFTGGFFGVHAVASAWVTARAEHGRSQASALYLMGYYLGSSIGGTLIGLAWASGGWPEVVGCVAGCFLLAGVVALGVPTGTA